MSTPFFSVVIPTYNRASLLQGTLESVFSQVCRDYEVIVVDDGSSDETPQVVAVYGDRIRHLRQMNRGPGAARNLATDSARGRYVAFLDSDDLWFPWSLEVYARVIQDHGGPAFIAGKPRRFAAEEELRGVRLESTSIKPYSDYYASGSRWRWWGASSFVIRLDALRLVGGFSSANVNGEDADLALKLGVVPGFIQVLTPDTFAYREHAGSVMHDLEKTIAGVWLQISSERERAYPGGARRAKERWRIVTRHLRPVSLECVKQRKFAESWSLYCAAFRWHFYLFRVKYLLALPILLVVNMLSHSSVTKQNERG